MNNLILLIMIGSLCALASCGRRGDPLPVGGPFGEPGGGTQIPAIAASEPRPLNPSENAG